MTRVLDVGGFAQRLLWHLQCTTKDLPRSGAWLIRDHLRDRHMEHLHVGSILVVRVRCTGRITVSTGTAKGRNTHFGPRAIRSCCKEPTRSSELPETNA